MSRFKEPAQLHNHSKYSLLDAVPSPEEWVAWCLENNTPGFAITDHGTAISMYDAIRFKDHIAAYNKEHKTSYPLDAVTGIPGVELYVKLNPEDKGHYHITCWATSNEGYFNLMKLASEAYKDTVSYFGSVKARVTYDMIQKYKKGIKFGTGCIAGPIGNAIMQENNYALAEERFLMYKEMFGEDLYIEFHTNDVTHQFNKKTGTFSPFQADECSCDGNKQRGYNLFLRAMVDKYGGKAIPVTDAHFIEPEDKILQDCLLKNGNDNGWYFYESYHQQRAEQMFEKLKTHLGDWLTEEKFKQWIENTYEIMNAAKTIDIKFDYHLPAIPIPDDIKAQSADYDQQTLLLMEKKIKEHGRWKDTPEYKARYEMEKEVIMHNKKLNFIPYFLVYEDIGTFARSKNILQNIARGSAGGSLISYYLKIIHIDPIKANLPFERFLSHARIEAGSFPDIDADIGDTARPLVMDYLKKKYDVGFAQIATFQKIKTKNAIKDSMYAIYGKNRKDPEVEAICNTISDSPQGVDEEDFLYGFTDEEGNYNLGELEINDNLKAFFNRYPDVEKMVKRLIGGIRGWSRHASAFVISTLDLSGTRVPTMVMKDKVIGEIICTQYNASMVEKCGLVKADILGIKTLSAVSDCIDLIKERTAGRIDFREVDSNGVDMIYRLPKEDAVFDDFCLKKTDSSFQFNTSLIKGMVEEFKPRTRQHLADLTALARPGALDFKIDGIKAADGQTMPDMSAANLYMKVKAGLALPKYIHPDLEPILGDTYSVAVYQEQIMRILTEIGGFTGEESDMVRSAISKKKKDVIQSTFDKLRDSASKRGWTKDQGEQLCKMVEAFSRYSFNRSHSYAYAELGYITMFLKHYYPKEWWTAVLNSEHKEDKIREHITLLGTMVAPPSAKYPADIFKIKDDKIVAPIRAIKGIGPSVVGELCSKGPFTSLEDFVERVTHNKVNTGGVSALIKGRAMDDFIWSHGLPYADQRQELMERYISLRGGKVSLKPELNAFDPMSVFLMEREANRCFNKRLLDDADICNTITGIWPKIELTGNKHRPMKYCGVHVLAGINVAKTLLDLDYQQDVSMILLYESSTLTRGVSKKSGRPWTKLSVKLSDGYSTIECVSWNMKKALKWPVNSIVYVKGTLEEGWKTTIGLKIREVERIDGDNT